MCEGLISDLHEKQGGIAHTCGPRVGEVRIGAYLELAGQSVVQNWEIPGSMIDLVAKQINKVVMV